MHIGTRLETIAALVPQGSKVADIGTDHAYLPVWLMEQGKITEAIAGDIAAGPCQAARNTVAMYGLKNKIDVRQGSGLEVLQPGEADCITIAGMGGSTIISILEASLDVAVSAKTLVLQPMAGAAGLRRWLVEHGWRLADEELVDDPPHFYEIICAVRGDDRNYSDAEYLVGGLRRWLVEHGWRLADEELVDDPPHFYEIICAVRGDDRNYSDAEYLVGPCVLQKRHALLGKQLARQLQGCRQLLENMGRSECAKESAKYQQELEMEKALEVLAYETGSNSK